MICFRKKTKGMPIFIIGSSILLLILNTVIVLNDGLRISQIMEYVVLLGLLISQIFEFRKKK
jgi:hypothetical protein